MCVCVCVFSDDVAEGQRSLIKDHAGFVPCEVEDANHSLFNCDLLTLSFLWCMLAIVWHSLPGPVGSLRVQNITRPSASVTWVGRQGSVTASAIHTHTHKHIHTHTHTRYD